jgi:hypothetical protein
MSLTDAGISEQQQALADGRIVIRKAAGDDLGLLQTIVESIEVHEVALAVAGGNHRVVHPPVLVVAAALATLDGAQAVFFNRTPAATAAKRTFFHNQTSRTQVKK